MEKEFDDWNTKKKEIHQRADAPFYGERELWWCSLGVNVGFEQDGSGKKYDRPVLILRGFSKETCLVIPLTTSVQHHPLRPSIGIVERKEAHALLSQMRIIDTKRLIRKIGFLDKEIFEAMRKAAKDLL
ncbi:type II toxin-antitoxin system PemK/MazF family toxin [Bradyrhizobium sp. 26S5]|uniref:type II toxin-antitoxin system PemK/MazF family toxin n=1 Tax=Bradyrhizobium sp. 26S5 TaxID=3139729 RepID=UPI0030D3B413